MVPSTAMPSGPSPAGMLFSRTLGAVGSSAASVGRSLKEPPPPPSPSPEKTPETARPAATTPMPRRATKTIGSVREGREAVGRGAAGGGAAGGWAAAGGAAGWAAAGGSAAAAAAWPLSRRAPGLPPSARSWGRRGQVGWGAGGWGQLRWGCRQAGCQAALGLRWVLAGQGGPRRSAQVARREVALVGLLCQRSGDHRVEGGRRPWDGLRGARRLVVQLRVHLRHLGVPVVRGPARQRVEEQAAQRVHVGPRVGALALDLLRWHVVRRAHERTGPRQRRARPGSLGQPEVGQVHVLLPVRRGQHHVRGLDVAVHQPAAVGGVECSRDLLDDPDRAFRLDPALGHDHRPQIGPLDPAHRDEQLALRVARLVDRDHVRVLDRRGQARLALEARTEVRLGGQLRHDQLERDLPVEAHLGRAVHAAHPALSGEALDPVAGQDRANRDLGHGPEYRR